MKLSLAKPDITQKEIDAVVEVMKSGVLSIGPRIKEFEKKVAEYIGVKHAIAVNSGTSGLHLLIRALGIKEGDEVITTPFSFISSSNCILFERAKPVFVDIDPYTLDIDINRIEEKITDKTKAILAVDVFGHPVDIKRLRAIADEYGLKLIEDACEALGSEYDGIKVGSMADGAVFAFYPNKQITTGEGGMIVTNSDEVNALCRSLRNQGRSKCGLWLEHEYLGYNYRMNELSAAIGSVQMDRLDEIIKKRCMVANMYNEALSGIKGITLPYISPKVTVMSWFVYVIRLEDDKKQAQMMQHLIDSGISCRPYFSPIHLQKYMVEQFGYTEGSFPVAEKAGRTCIALPFYNDMSADEIEYIAEKIREGLS